MATATEPRAGEQHRAAQAALTVLVVRAVLHAWQALLDPRDLKGSTPRLVAAVEAIVAHFARASATAALTDYRNQRRAAGVLGRPTLPMPTLPTHDDVAGLVNRSLSPLYGPVTPDLEANVRDALASEVEQMVLDQSRAAIIGATQADPAARAWARVTEPGACSFCRLLATRGAVYRSESTANFRAHTVQPNGSGGTCRCHVEPVFGPYEPTAQARIDKAAYDRLTEEYGHSGRAIHIAWRQHVEGRPVTGPLTKPYTRGT